MDVESEIHRLAVVWFEVNGVDEVYLETMFDIVKDAYTEAKESSF